MPRALSFPQRADLEDSLRDLIKRAIRDLKLGPEFVAQEGVFLEIPKNRSHGDLSSPVALQLASKLKKPALELASILVQQLQSLLKNSPLNQAIDRMELKAPGFINFFLKPHYLIQVLQEALRLQSRYGRSTLGKGSKAMVEFVSANPTGPLSVAHGRQAAVGDALANLLAFVGYRVTREFYLNDEGTQIDLLGASILARARESLGLQVTFPENGYKGDYIAQLGLRLVASKGRRILESPRALEVAREFGVRELTKVIQGELDLMGVHFDRWFAQSALRRLGYLNRTLGILKKRGFLYESEGAWWLKSTAFGDDKDRVVIRSDGRMTYIAADIAYHRQKFDRGFRLLINLWGPDHHGYIPRLKAAVQALGFPAQALKVQIVQLCTLKRKGQTIPMSTREGEFITLREVLDEVGSDAARFFFLLRKSDAHLEFDVELAKEQSLENPVYYIQYAHARISNILEYFKKQGQSERSLRPDYSRLVSQEEIGLLRLIREFPGVVEMSANSLEPFGFLEYLKELAEAFHRFYDTHRVVGEDPGLTAARLRLVKGVQIVLAKGLSLLGVSAPTKM